MIIKKKLDPKKLRPHPLNVELWGDAEPDAEFVESVRVNGVLESLFVTSTGTIISGHWRHAAALLVGLEEVPVEMNTEAMSDLEISNRLIEMNRRRPQTTEQRTRAYARLKVIKEQLAAERMRSGKPGGKVPPGSGSTKSRAPKSAELAAEAVGMSAKTAEKAATVVKKIDAASAAGDTETASKLRGTLNNESVAAAHRLATESEAAPVAVIDELGQPVPERLHAVFAVRQRFDRMLGQVRWLKSEAKLLADTKGGEHLRFNTLQVDLDNVRNHLRFAMPHSLCCYCDGTDKTCDACHGEGWITEAIRDQAPQGKKETPKATT